MTHTELCDGCGRGCPLSAPTCGLGFEIARQRAQQAEGSEGFGEGSGGGKIHERAEGEHVQGGDRARARKARGNGRGFHHGDGHGAFSGNHEESGDKLLVYRFHHCAHLLMHRRAKEGGRAGALMVLSRHGVMSQRALAERLDIRSASASELLVKMEELGLITRTPDGNDKRAVLVELTELGRQEAARLAEQREKSNKDLFAVLTDEEKRQLENILGKLTPYWHEEFDREGGTDDWSGGRGGRHGHGARGGHGALGERGRYRA